MIEVEITEEQRDRAYDISNPGKVFNQNKTGARAGFIGALGEIVVSDYLGIKPHVYDEELEVYDYDIMYKDKRLEVKTMNLYKPPSEITDCCTTTYYSQKCDGYVFVGLLADKSKAWIEGYITAKRFFKDATLMEKGTTRPRDGFVYRWDNWVTTVGNLDPIDKLVST